MTNGDETVGTHHCQQKCTGELADGCYGQVYFAQYSAKQPMFVDECNQYKYYTDQKHFVGYGQVEDVHVGHCLHLGVPQHHVDYK